MKMSELFAGAQRAEAFEEEPEVETGGPGTVEQAATRTNDEDSGDAGGVVASEVKAGASEGAVPHGLSGGARGELLRPGAAERVRATWGWRGFLVRATG